MADVTPILINQLAAQTTLADSDYFIVGGADAKKITVAQMKEALGINELNGKTILINRSISDFNSAADGVTFFDTTSSIANNPSLATGGFLFQQSIRIAGYNCKYQILFSSNRTMFWRLLWYNVWTDWVNPQ